MRSLSANKPEFKRFVWPIDVTGVTEIQRITKEQNFCTLTQLRCDLLEAEQQRHISMFRITAIQWLN